MIALFMVCAAVGGTILALQLLMTLIGLGGEAMHGDVPRRRGRRLRPRRRRRFSRRCRRRFHGDTGGHFARNAHGHAHARRHRRRTSVGRLPQVLSVSHASWRRDGLLRDRPAWRADAADFVQRRPSLTVARGRGLAAMFGVYWLMQSSTACEPKARCGSGRRWAARHGLRARPPAHSGAGKIQLNLQNRTMEYLAMTAGERLPTGAKVVVTDVITSDTLEVQPASPNRKGTDMFAAFTLGRTSSAERSVSVTAGGRRVRGHRGLFSMIVLAIKQLQALPEQPRAGDLRQVGPGTRRPRASTAGRSSSCR